MSRPRNDSRRMALLDAATHVFAKHGLQAPTALISKTARISEGSLFTYFKTKEDLVTALYLDLRVDLASAISSNFPRRSSVRARFEHVFKRYVTWGVAYELKRKALRSITLSNLITPEVRAQSSDLFAEVDRLLADALQQRLMKDLPAGMASQALKAIAEMTMDLIDRDPGRGDEYLTAGFQMLWGALARKP